MIQRMIMLEFSLMMQMKLIMEFDKVTLGRLVTT